MLPLLIVLVLGAAADDGSRTYHQVAIADFATSIHTHVCTTGKVRLVKKEADGDIHIRLVDGKKFIVAEIIPKLPLPAPKKGETITVCGIRRHDDKHNWSEVHPVEYFK